MPEASAAGRNRWYRVKWPDQRNLSPAWAEKYFDNHAEAFDYFERRRAEHPTGPCNHTRNPLSGPSAWIRYDRRHTPSVTPSAEHQGNDKPVAGPVS